MSIKKRKKTKCIGLRVPLVAALTVNQTWSMDFVSDAINRPGAVSRRIKCLTVADEFSHECVDITADFGIGGDYVTRLLDRAATFRGYPQAVRTDNGYRAGVHLPLVHDMGAKKRRQTHPDRAGQLEPERLHREL